MSDVSQILLQIKNGDTGSAEALLPLVYEELRRLAANKMAAERADHTLQPTALVHEAYLRLVGNQSEQVWDSREHFFSAAAEAMRRILIDAARARLSQKRGGNRTRLPPEMDLAETICSSTDLLLDVDDALVNLQAEDPEAAELVKLRLFAGLGVEEAGCMLGMSRATAYRTWDYARSWFSVQLNGESRK